MEPLFGNRRKHSHRRRYLYLAVVALVLVAAGNLLLSSKTSLPSIPEEILEGFEERVLRTHLEHLSSDLLEGRGTGTRGESLAVSYIQSQMNLAGLETFVQEVPLVGLTPVFKQQKALSFGEVELRYKEDFVLATDSAVQQVTSSVSEVVFVGFGISAPEYDWNDFKGVKVEGKVLLAFVNEPAPTRSEPTLFSGQELTYYGRWMYKVEEARRRKARALILIHTEQTAGYPFSVISNQLEQVQLEDVPGNPLEWRMWLTEQSTRRILALSGSTIEELYRKANAREFRPQAISVKMSLNLEFQTRLFSGTNILGILRGTTNQDECVLISTHHDHLGTDSSVAGDGVYNGAEDNASGVAALLTAVKSMAQQEAPKRSICFLSVTAEEYGLLGSFYYTMHPVFPLEKTIIDVNFDIMNVHGATRDIVGLGAGLSELKYLLEEAATLEGLRVSEDPNPSSGSFFRSDTFAFARAGIPSVYLWTGMDFVGKAPGYYQQVRGSYVQNRYHQPSDHYDPRWSMAGVIQQLRVAVRICYGVANSSLRPQWLRGQTGGFL